MLRPGVEWARIEGGGREARFFYWLPLGERQLGT